MKILVITAQAFVCCELKTILHLLHFNIHLCDCFIKYKRNNNSVIVYETMRIVSVSFPNTCIVFHMQKPKAIFTVMLMGNEKLQTGQ